MQEKLALRRTLKKVAAVGTSLAMVGITISGALAAGLSDYPTVLGFNKNVGQSLVVYGADADNAAAQDVLAGLPGGTTTTTTATASTKASWNDLELDTTNGFNKEITLGTLLGSSGAFGTSIRESRVKGFKQGNLPISVGSTSSSPKYHEQLNFDAGSATGCYVTTGITLGNINRSNDAYGENPVLYGPSGCMDYQIKLDEALTSGNTFANASSTSPIEVPFLGSTVLIEGATASNTITAVIGKQFVMAVNDVVNFDAHTFTLSTVGSSTVAVTSDACPGQSILLDGASTGSSRSCGDYVLRARDVTGGGTGISGTPSARITIGKATQGGAVRSSAAGDYFIGQDKNTPFWTWKLAGLFDTGVGTVNVSAQLGQSLTSYNGPDSPNYLLPKRLPQPGDKLCWPNNYVCISFDKMTQNVDDFGKYRVRVDVKDLYNAGDTATIATGQSVILIESLSAGANIGLQDDGGTDADALALWLNASGLGAHFRKSASTNHYIQRSSSLILAGIGNTYRTNTPASSGVEDRLNPTTQIGSVNYKSTTFPILANVNSTSAWTTNGNGTLEFDMSGTGTAGREFDIFLKPDGSGASQFIGHSQGGATYANDIIYRSTTAIDISDFKNKAMTEDGIIIESYANTRGSDELAFWVPPDTTNYKAVLTVAQPKGTAVAGDGTTTTASVLVKDTEAPTTLTNYNVVVVGGPCVNQVAANFLTNGVKSCGSASGLAAGEAVLALKANGSKKALLVYGWEADDTRRAAVLLKDPAVLTQKLKDAGVETKDSVMVKGTSLEVAGITVA